MNFYILGVKYLSIIVLLLLLGCSKQEDNPVYVPPPPPPVVTGNWNGLTTGMIIYMTIAESNKSVSGSGTITFLSGTFAITVSGVHSDPDVNFTFKTTGFQDANFSGKLSNESTMTGFFNGSGFNYLAFNFVKLK